MAKNKIAEAIAARREQQNPQDQNQPDKQNQNQPNQELEFLKTQVASLQQQLLQRNSESEQRKLELEAERLRKEEEALQEEANLRQSLSGAFQGKDLEEELSQKELVSILADAVGKSSEAQTKLIMNQVGKLIGQSNEKIGLTQKALIEVIQAMDVNSAANKYQDFNNYREDIATLMSRSNLSSEDAYLLAKAKRQSLAPNNDELASERPNTPPQNFTRSERTVPDRGSRTEEDYSEYNPRVVFKDAVSSAIDNVLARRNK